MAKVELKTVSQLLGKKFTVPLYQRGYRWEAQQVKDLLDDIEEFMLRHGFIQNTSTTDSVVKANSHEIDDFYCLQPLAVKETIKDKAGFIAALPKTDGGDPLCETRKAITDNVRWEVIDGQQRLTTIFIILRFLGYLESSAFDIEFIRWTNQKKLEDVIKDDSEEKAAETIDYWHIHTTLEAAKVFFDGDDGKKLRRNTDEYKEIFRDTLLKKVQFIWYESDEEDPVKVFTRLNIGKIALTNSELIKALFLNRSNFTGGDFEKVRLRQMEIASRWDGIEAELQNDEFWMFLHEPGFDKPTRIDFIFDLVYELKLFKRFVPDGFWEKICNDKYRTFRYFNEYFDSKDAHTEAENNGTTIIEQCWREVDAIFAAFKEWFDNLEFYHYVGFLVACRHDLKELINQWGKGGGTKGLFLSELKAEIKKEISDYSDLGKQYETAGAPQKTKCGPLLLLHNIQCVIKQNVEEKLKYGVGTFYKFPFHLFKMEKWNVEHIDSNTENSLEKEKDRDEWLKSAWCFLHDEKTDSNITRQIIEYFQNKRNNSSGEEFENIRNSVSMIIPKGAPMDENEKNQIGNFTLLDESTNKSYGNAIFPVKKMILFGKSQGLQYKFEDDRNDSGVLKGFKVNSVRLGSTQNVIWKTAFVPPVTLRAFLKAFKPVSGNPWSWDADDAIAYRNNIYETLKEFGVTLPAGD